MPIISFPSTLWHLADSVSFLSLSVRSMMKYLSHCYSRRVITDDRHPFIMVTNNSFSRVVSAAAKTFKKKSILVVRTLAGFAK